MTLMLRNTILRAAMLISVALLGVYGLSLYRLLDLYPDLSRQITQTGTIAAPAGERMQLGVWSLVAAAGIIGLFNAVWISALIRRFRKRTAPEVFFFMIFLATVSLDLLKPLTLLTAVQPVPLVYRAALTRVLYFGYLFGSLCLFSASLGISVIDSKRTGTALGIAAAVAAAFAYLVPVDVTELYPSLLHRIGVRGVAHATAGAISVFAVVNFLYAGMPATDREYAILAASIALVVLGRHVVFHLAYAPALILGTAAFIAGALIFGLRSHRRYLWL